MTSLPKSVRRGARLEKALLLKLFVSTVAFKLLLIITIISILCL